MELSRTEYPSLLTALPPTPAVTVLRERLRKGQLLNSEVADWLQERRKIEDSYVQGLLRLARKQPPGDASELGIFRAAWDRIINTTSQLAESHLHFAQKIDTEIERPLREFATVNKDWTGLKTCDANLAGLAKQIDTAEDKADKLRKKGTRAQASKVAEAMAAVAKATGDWESQAPFIFEKFQAADETRWNTLRDCLTQYHTLEVDQAQRSMQLANESLSTLLDLNTTDEIKTFVETVTHGKPKVERQGSKVPTTASAGMPSSTPSIVTDDSVSIQSAGSGSGGGSGSGLGHGLGLRRLGTVLRGRNRNSAVPYMRPSSPVQSSERLSFKKEGPASPRSPEFTMASSQNLSIPAPSIGEPTQPSSPKANGVGSQGTQLNGFTPPPTVNPLQPPLIPTLSVTDQPQQDSEGFTIPPPVMDIGGVPLDDSAEPAQPQFKLEIKNDVIPEEEEEAGAAMSKVTSHLRMQNQAPRKTRGRRDARDVRTTMFFHAGAGSQDPLEMLSNSSPPLTPLKVPRMTPAVPSEPSDTQSVRSSRSVTSFTGGALLRHPELHERGLSSSLVESVNVSFESEKPIKVTVIGEIALAYNPSGTEILSSQTPQIVRVDNFPLFEKVAPNPAFINTVTDKAGEYSVFLSHLHRTTVAFKYRLHLEESTWSEYLPIIISPMWRVEPHQASVILNYKLNPNYRLLAVAEHPITLRNITFITGVEGVVPTSCQSKPVGIFSREMGRIAWKIGDITLDSTSAVGKLVARFMIDSGAGVAVKPVPSEMRWEVVGDEAVKAASPLGLSALESVDEASEEVNPFADEESVSKSGKILGGRMQWREVVMVKRVVSGQYYGL